MRKTSNSERVNLYELSAFFFPETRTETDPRKLIITPIKRSKPKKKRHTKK